MKQEAWNNGLNHIDSDLVEEFIANSEKNEKRKGNGKIWLRVGALAACVCLILGAVLYMLDAGNSPIIPVINRPDIPVVHIQPPSGAPNYAGTPTSVGYAGPQVFLNPSGISVIARFVEALPDTYTFYDDWRQYEFRIVKMELVKLLIGTKMTEEFYFIMPVEFMTDLSLYDRFTIKDMAQYGHEYMVVYNQTQGCAERLELVLCGYSNYGHNLMGGKMMAFDAVGMFDMRLWKSNDAWAEATDHYEPPETIDQAEEKICENGDIYQFAIHSVHDLSGEAAEILAQVASGKNGIYVQNSSGRKLNSSAVMYYYATRYINGYATNEAVKIVSKDYNNADADTYSFTKARFTEEDLKMLPDLPSAVAAVTAEFEAGRITPPHIRGYAKMKQSFHGICGWYAKTPEGVIGIVRVNLSYMPLDENGKPLAKWYYDDLYYIIEYGSDVCKHISRDALLRRLGEYETTNIYDGGYNKYGKNFGDQPYY